MILQKIFNIRYSLTLSMAFSGPGVVIAHNSFRNVRKNKNMMHKDYFPTQPYSSKKYCVLFFMYVNNYRMTYWFLRDIII